MNRTLLWLAGPLTALSLAGCPAVRPAPDATDVATDAATPSDIAAADDAADAAPDARGPDASGPRAECNPLGFPAVCAAPFPSAYHLRDDATSATGVRVALASRGFPVTRGSYTQSPNEAFDPAAWNSHDGFSPSQPFVVYFPERIDPASLVGWAHLEASVQPGASTALIDMETHARVAHFAEVDATARPDQRQTLVIRPMVRLRPGHRYAVAVTRAIRTTAGTPPATPPGFQALLDDAPARDPRLATIAPRYPAIFAALQAAGIAREDLVLAWDHVTASEQYLTAPVLAMRDAALAMVGADGMPVTVTSVEEDFNVNILRRVQGTFRVPLFLTNNGGDRSVLHREADGTPSATGFYDVPFVAMVPRVAATRGPLPLLLIGHGLLGSGVNELGDAAETGNYVQRLLNAQGYIAVATNWIGLSSNDLGDALYALSNFNRLTVLTDRLQQALINAMVLYRTARARFPTENAFQVAGAPAIDASRTYFYGISLGGIMGTSFMAYSPDCDRGVLNVPGGNWSLLLQRSSNFSAFAIALTDYPNPDDRQILLSLAQQQFDFSDPINVAPHLLADRLAGVPAKHVLFQMAVGDAQVNNLATEMTMRTMGVPLLAPTPRHVYAVTEMEGPLDSAYTIWDEHPTPLPPGTNEPATTNRTHSSLRDEAALKEQIRRFFQPDGRVEHTCDGPCDPE